MEYKKFSNIIEKISLGFAQLTINNDEIKFVDTNTAFKNLLSIKDEKLKGIRLNSLVNSKKINLELFQFYEEIISKREDKVIEHYFKYIDKWFKIDIFFENLSFYTIFDDITDRKKLETEQLALSSIIENSSDVGVLKDCDLKYVIVNQAYLDLTGYGSKDILIGKTDKDLFEGKATDDEIEQYIKNDKAALKLNKGQFILKEEYLAGRVFSTKKFPVFNKKDIKIGVATITSEITERKLMEKKILDQKMFLESVVNALPGLLNVVDTDLNVIASNSARLKAGAIKYNDITEVIGKKCYNVFMGRETVCPWCKIDKVLKTGETIIDITTPKDPREKTSDKALKVILTPVRDSNENITGVVEYGIDVTELREIAEKAKAANRAKTQFLANMSHEIRTPLNSVIGFTDLLLSTDIDSVQKEYILNANRSGRELLDIINDILDYSQIEFGKLELNIVENSSKLFIDKIVNTIRYQVENKRLNFISHIDKNIPKILNFDPERLQQVVLNLVSNSVKFTKNGEIKLKIDFDKDQQKLYFSIKDSGIGIKTEDQNKLFKAFSQVDGSTTRKFGGIGLGLVITSLLVQKMGGKLDFESEFGKGSTFFFSIDI